MDLQDLTVLYVEDDQLTRDTVGRMLERRVKTLSLAENGKAGLALFKEKEPDIVITDIKMPLMNGLDMAREIKALHRETMIIVTTAHNDAEYLMRGIDIGIDQYVLKPIKGDSLFAALDKCAVLSLFDRETRRRNEERDRMIGELREALDKVKLLSGFLPICSSCKKIRDDKGAWTQMEAYITEHTDAEFSHGICSECAEKLYPEYFKKK